MNVCVYTNNKNQSGLIMPYSMVVVSHQSLIYTSQPLSQAVPLDLDGYRA